MLDSARVTHSEGDAPRTERRQRNHSLVIEEILATARAIMREEGAAGLSMHELARRMGMRPPSLYHYFAGKYEIYDVLFRRGFAMYDEFQTRWQAAGSVGPANWRDALRGFLEGYMAFALEHPDLYQLCFERPIPGFVPSPASLQVSFEVLRRGYETAARWQREIDTGLPPEKMADLVLAVMHGLTALHMANEPSLPVGAGRFGGLIPAAVSLFEHAWSVPARPEGNPL